FIDRPVLAWVISCVIVLLGGITAALLPVAEYPEISPPTVRVTANYPGANARVVADTVAVRGADDQVTALYAREETQLFPSPGLLMGDSFFGTYARRDDGSLSSGRLYLGIHWFPSGQEQSLS